MINTNNKYFTQVLTEKEKKDEDYLVSCVDTAISELVYDKDYLKKAYNYWYCHSLCCSSAIWTLSGDQCLSNRRTCWFTPTCRTREC